MKRGEGKGILTGKEIFEQEGFVATDDASASDAYSRDVNEEDEILKMHEKARADLELASKSFGDATHQEQMLEDIDLDSDDEDVLEALAAEVASKAKLEDSS